MTAAARTWRHPRDAVMGTPRGGRPAWSSDVHRNGVAEDDELARCVWPLLDALGWEGAPRRVAEALPHLSERMTIQQFRDVMALLGYESIRMPRLRCDGVDPQLLPAFVLTDDGRALVICRPDRDGRTMVRNPARGTEGPDDLRRLRGDVCVFRPVSDRGAEQRAAEAGRWTSHVTESARGAIVGVGSMSLTASLVTVAAVLLLKEAIDQSLSPTPQGVALALLLAAAAVIAAEGALQFLRARLLARIAGRVSSRMTLGIFRHLLHLPLSESERMRLCEKLERLRLSSFIHNGLSGPLAATFLDATAIAPFIVAIAFLGGGLALVPLLGVAAFFVCALLLLPASHRQALRVTQSRLQKQDFIAEAMLHKEHIRLSGATRQWRERFRELSGEAALTQFDRDMFAAWCMGFAWLVAGACMLMVILFGSVQVVDGTLSPGAFAPIAILSWWSLGSSRRAFCRVFDFGDVRAALNTIDQALKAHVEDDTRTNDKDVPPLRAGKISLARLSFWYAPDLDPAISDLSAEIPPGAVVALTGPNGGGKSTLLKLILGLHQPQVGKVLLDGVDIRRHPSIALRQAIGYVPQDFDLFYGTIRQNLLLSMPTSCAEDIEQAARRAGVHEAIMAWSDGYAHRVGDVRSCMVPATVRNGLALASAYLRAPRLLLLDEAIDNLDDRMTDALYAEIDRLRGKTTIVMITHRPSTMRRADRLLVMRDGMIVKSGKPSELLD